MSVGELPYRLPDAWQVTAAKPLGPWAAVLWMLVAITVAAGAVARLLHGDFIFGTVLALVAACVAVVVGVTVKHAGGERGMPRFINAVALSNARVRPPDSWIHFFREARPEPRLIMGFTAAGLFGSTAFAWAGILAVAAGGDAPLMLIALVPLLLGALVVALAGVLSAVIRWRHSSFGRRHIGLSIGRHGVSRYYLDEVSTWSWDSITEVRAIVSAVDASNGSFMPGVVIAHGEDEDGLAEHTFHLDDHEAHAWLIYTALRFWAEHPEHRDELSATFAQQRMAGWRDAMIATAAAPVTTGSAPAPRAPFAP